MNFNSSCGVGLLALALLTPSAAAEAASERVLSFLLHQDGFSEDAYISGRLTGVDRDKNGILLYFPEGGGGPIDDLEVTSFSMSFSGNSLAPAFTLGFEDLFGIVFEINSGDVGDDPAFDPTLGVNLGEGIGVIGDRYFYTSGEGPNNFIGGFVGGELDLDQLNDFADAALDSSDELLYLKLLPVPEPASGALALAAGMMLLVRRRWRT